MLTYAVFSDKGDRSYNEDSTYAVATENEGCFALADGLGGQGKGDVASKFVVEEVKKKYDQKRKKCLEKFITDMVSECQRDLMEVKGQEDITEDMMTTLVVLLVDDNQVSWGHVGDSRLYHFSDGKIVERTKDHSVCQVLAATGEIDESEIRHHPDRNRLLRAVGMHDQMGILNSVQTIEKKENRHQFLICSDGFWEYIDEKYMEKTLKRAKTPEDWLRKMTRIVKKNGRNKNMDNYSAIAVFLD